MFQVSRRVSVCGAALGLAALAALAPLSPFAAASPLPATGVAPVRVDAGYKITLNGFDLGTFNFKSDVGRTRYTLDTDVDISALLGVFRWKGVTHSTGALKPNALVPADFRFDYESTVRNGSVAMGFGKDGVDRLSVLPVTVEAPDTVPLAPDHLKGVFDPLSAILAITHSDAPSPCGRTFAIFDGKQRFDIALKFVRKEPVAGIPTETAIVCRVKYTPIAGYRPTDDTRQLAASNDIEIVFRLVPAAKLMLPQSVAVPTAIGTARIDLDRVNIQVLERGRVASVD